MTQASDPAGAAADLVITGARIWWGPIGNARVEDTVAAGRMVRDRR